jgi:all-trans-retinol dehydrogenase (NAD+)
VLATDRVTQQFLLSVRANAHCPVERAASAQTALVIQICPFFIKTGMFEGAKSRWPMLVPLLEPEYASSKIVRAVRCNQAVLIMPLVVHLTPIARALFPVPIFDELIDWMGVLDTMEDFVGRKKAE